LDSRKHFKQTELSGLAILLLNERDRFQNRFQTKNVLFTQSQGWEEESKEHESSDYGDFFCGHIVTYGAYHTIMKSYNDYIKKNRARFVVTINDVESIINSSHILAPLHDISPRIEWVTEQPGRQLVGSFHPVRSIGNNNFYACAYDPNWRKPNRALKSQ